MKKVIFLAVVLSLLISAPAFAEEAKNGGIPGMSMSDMEKKCGSMKNKAQMVATDEGGVIVLAGNKLMKYDADLNLVKEAELKMPMGSMGGKQCPMTGKMTEKNAAPAAAEPEEKAA